MIDQAAENVKFLRELARKSFVSAHVDFDAHLVKALGHIHGDDRYKSDKQGGTWLTEGHAERQMQVRGPPPSIVIVGVGARGMPNTQPARGGVSQGPVRVISFWLVSVVLFPPLVYARRGETGLHSYRMTRSAEIVMVMGGHT